METGCRHPAIRGRRPPDGVRTKAFHNFVRQTTTIATTTTTATATTTNNNDNEHNIRLSGKLSTLAPQGVRAAETFNYNNNKGTTNNNDSNSNNNDNDMYIIIINVYMI